MSREIARYNPWKDMATLQRSLDRMAESFGQRDAQMAVDVFETDDNYTVVTELPGFDDNNINIFMEKQNLVIEAQIEAEELPEDTNVLVRERRYGRFARRLELPRSIDVDNIEATFVDGLLTVTLPKAPESQPRRIQVKSSHQN